MPDPETLMFAVDGVLLLIGVAFPSMIGRWVLARIEHGRTQLIDDLEVEVCQRRAAEGAARRAALEAERAQEAKTRFLATMIHELRTPMNGVLGAAQLLEHTRLDPEQADLVSTIAGSGEVLLGVINDVLDAS